MTIFSTILFPWRSCSTFDSLQHLLTSWTKILSLLFPDHSIRRISQTEIAAEEVVSSAEVILTIRWVLFNHPLIILIRNNVVIENYWFNWRNIITISKLYTICRRYLCQYLVINEITFAVLQSVWEESDVVGGWVTTIRRILVIPSSYNQSSLPQSTHPVILDQVVSTKYPDSHSVISTMTIPHIAFYNIGVSIAESQRSLIQIICVEIFIILLTLITIKCIALDNVESWLDRYDLSFSVEILEVVSLHYVEAISLISAAISDLYCLITIASMIRRVFIVEIFKNIVDDVVVVGSWGNFYL